MNAFLKKLWGCIQIYSNSRGCSGWVDKKQEEGLHLRSEPGRKNCFGVSLSGRWEEGSLPCHTPLCLAIHLCESLQKPFDTCPLRLAGILPIRLAIHLHNQRGFQYWQVQSIRNSIRDDDDDEIRQEPIRHTCQYFSVCRLCCFTNWWVPKSPSIA